MEVEVKVGGGWRGRAMMKMTLGEGKFLASL